MNTLSEFVIARRRWVAALWLVALVCGIAATGGINKHLSNEFSLPGQPGFKANQQIVAQYGNGASVAPLVPVVTLPPGTTVDDPAAKAALTRGFDSVATIKGVRVASYANTGDRHFVSADGRTSYGLVFRPPFATNGFNDNDIAAQSATTVADLKAALPAGSVVQLTGMDPLATAGTTSSGSGVLTEALLSGLGALAVLLFVFGSLLALLPLLVAAVSVTSSFLAILGLTYLTDVSSIVQFLVGVIGLGVAIDYSLLVVTRWREEIAHGHDNETAVRESLKHAGSAVAFSGVTVAIGLASMLVLPVPFLRSIALGGMTIPLVSVLVSLTLLPALLLGVGKRLDWPKLRQESTASRGWTRWAGFIVKRRWIAALVSLAVLGFLFVAAFGLKIGEPGADSLANAGPARAGLVTLEHSGFSTGVLTPIEVLAPKDSAAAVTAAAEHTGGVLTAISPTGAGWQHDSTAMVVVIPGTETTGPTGQSILRHVRTATEQAAPAAMTGGSGATDVDMISAVYGNLPLMLTLIGLVTIVLLTRAFRSIVLAVKAFLLNVLSVGAVYGVLRLLWQDGHGSQVIFGVPATHAITSWVPLMVFAFLYGLSMDYEVFILSRMREEYDKSGSTTTAVVQGIGRTGRLVTCAALILFGSFAALSSSSETMLKIFGSALAIGILLDATVVRALLVPALVSLLGRWNWYLPGWAARALRVAPSPLPVPTEDVPERVPEPSVAG
ncbi:MMPL family transporter [Streptacidiphilus cavernicola]|uniref:MMPL family transporter n=1 Tax=Streptacidiphilus cavernicola TaxID=3342716 RepID=A0ABV6VQZ4_9ACTN